MMVAFLAGGGDHVGHASDLPIGLAAVGVGQRLRFPEIDQ